MNREYAVLPCNGLDKCAGCVSKEIAIMLSENSENEIICPVLFHTSDVRYIKTAQEKSLLVIDGCATRCASKLAAEKNLKISEKINVTEEAKAHKITLGKGLQIGEEEMRLAKIIVDKLTQVQEVSETEDSIAFPA